jgi:geranylgeranyl diphosphate synthase type II
VDITRYKETFLSYLEKEVLIKTPKNLYLPIEYIMNLGGKRIRPVLALMSCDLFGTDYNQAMEAALCVEMFHNFTLIHDDIMDKADLRRGKETVHKKWDLNAGILSGDALMILSYQRLESYDGNVYKELMSLFNQVAIEVCEGQQLDIDFESQALVDLDTYFRMISYKTAVLVGCSLRMGAIVASATSEDQEEIYNFGRNLGIAFQLQDDYLDTFGTSDFGKKIGGDILEHKKTYLYIKTLELADHKDRKALLEFYGSDDSSDTKVEAVKELFIKYQADHLLIQEIEKFTLQAFKNVERLSLGKQGKDALISFGNGLMKRKI